MSKSNNEAGVTLVEIMIAVAITIGLSAAAFSYLSNVEDFRFMMTRVSTRDAIAKRLETQLASYRNIQFSGLNNAGASAGNAGLRNCLDEGGANCTVKTAADQTSFAFFVDQGSAGAVQLAGTDGAPVLYDYNGRPNCVTAEAGCPAYEARAYFWGTCATGLATCARANQISVRFQVKPLKPMSNGSTVPSVPPDATFNANKSAFAIHHMVRNTPSVNVEEVCPVGAFQTGLHLNGKIKCTCSFNNAPVGIDPVTSNPTACIPTASQCPKDNVINGIKSDGKPWCCKIITNCAWKSFGNDTGGCGPGSWIESLDLGYCSDELGADDGKSGNKPIGCDKNRGYCCSYRVGACS